VISVFVLHIISIAKKVSFYFLNDILSISKKCMKVRAFSNKFSQNGYTILLEKLFTGMCVSKRYYSLPSWNEWYICWVFLRWRWRQFLAGLSRWFLTLSITCKLCAESEKKIYISTAASNFELLLIFAYSLHKYVKSFLWTVVVLLDKIAIMFNYSIEVKNQITMCMYSQTGVIRNSTDV
jgi:hypothetical protein